MIYLLVANELLLLKSCIPLKIERKI